MFRKEQILLELTEARQKILDAVSTIPDQNQDLIFLGVWSCRDLLAHLIGWDYTNIDAIKNVMKNEIPAFYKYHDHDWQTYNAMLVEKYKRDSMHELLAAAKDSHATLMQFLQTIPPDVFNRDFDVRFRGYKVTIQRLLEAEAKDEQIHYQQIQDFFKELK
jgi:hypothetical protein